VKQKKYIGEILQEMRFARPQHIKEALVKQSKDSGRRLGVILMEMGVINEAQLLQALSVQYDYPYLGGESIDPQPEVINMVPGPLCEQHCIIPLSLSGNSITMATSDPLDITTVENLKFILGRDIKITLATKSAIQEAIRDNYGIQPKTQFSDAIEQASGSTEIKIRSDEIVKEDATSAEDAPVIKFVQVMVQEAVKARASDIHVEPMEDRVKIRYRVDGVLQEVNEVPKRLHSSLMSRIKIMAEMDIAEKRKPQDGRISLNVMGKPLDIRVSSIPSVHGESIVMRLLDKEAGLVSLEELGLEESEYKRFRNIVKRPNGIILITGPTGSGKTTTLYAVLKELNNSDKKIITAENPIEYHLSGVNQCQVKEQIGLGFARILRAMLRQAPNIILVGEIRDQETAQVATQAALTGHLVFSTLHTNDAPGSLTRLADMGVKPFLIATSIQAVMAQRLVRKLCSCKQEGKTLEPGLLKALNLSVDRLQGRKIFAPQGCKNCKYTGYKGRIGIFELMEMDNQLREMVFKVESQAKIREYARSHGMVTLMEDGIRKILTGLTSLEEILSLTHREDINY
jgi:type IV pilus assembly protein PilB